MLFWTKRCRISEPPCVLQTWQIRVHLGIPQPKEPLQTYTPLLKPLVFNRNPQTQDLGQDLPPFAIDLGIFTIAQGLEYPRGPSEGHLLSWMYFSSILKSWVLPKQHMNAPFQSRASLLTNLESGRWDRPIFYVSPEAQNGTSRFSRAGKVAANPGIMLFYIRSRKPVNNATGAMFVLPLKSNFVVIELKLTMKLNRINY